MKNRISSKVVLFCICLSFAFTACKKENLDETVTIIPDPEPQARVLGEWELYKLERQELILVDIVDGVPLHTMEWYDQTSQSANESTLEFTDDNAFEEFYAEVSVGGGEWDTDPATADRYTFTFDGSGWSDLQDEYTVNMHCDQTMSVKYRVDPPAGNHEFQDEDWYVVLYYRTPGSVECDENIEYYVE